MPDRSKKLKIAIIAPPWLSTYPGCYYGIENVVHNLSTSLYEMGHEVLLFTVGGSTTPATKRYWYHKEDQYQHIHRPWYEVLPVMSAHILYALNVIRQIGDVDIVHDHNSFMGPAMMALACKDLPPILSTLHEPFTNEKFIAAGLPDNRMLFKELKVTNRLYFNGISKSQLSTVPHNLKKHMVKFVYNGVNLDDFTYQRQKGDYFLSVGSIKPDKGQATAAKLCRELGVKLKIAGTIGDITDNRQLAKELKKPSLVALNNPYFPYFRDKIMPHLLPGKIEYIGAVFGPRKKELFANAKAFLAPIQWEEPFGIAIIDALASGTPVVGYRRGAFPEIIEHGKNGFLADTEAQFKHYIHMADQIDPDECRRSVEKRFSASIMARSYVKRYQEVIRMASAAELQGGQA